MHAGCCALHPDNDEKGQRAGLTKIDCGVVDRAIECNGRQNISEAVDVCQLWPALLLVWVPMRL